jgi:type I restriction enzyme R subunit
MAKLGNERSAVQNTLIQYACEIGWEYIKPEDALRLRGGESGLIFKEVFRNQLIKLNDDFIDNNIIEELMRKIERLPPTIEGNLQAWEYLKGLKTVFVPDEKRERNVKLLDANPNNNIFQITEEFSYSNGRETNRYDIVFLINGIPILFVENKAVAKFIGKLNKESIISEALEQVRRYHRQTPEAMSLFQIWVATNIIHFLYSSTWSTSLKSIFNWKDDSKEKTYENLVKSFFNKERIIKTLLDFIIFTREDDELKKIILRPHQMRAVDKVISRAAHKTKKRGLIWHTQGSGKTYTMILSAQKILENPIFENPTVIMLVDRNELETQLFGNLSSVGFEEINIAKSKKHLRELLKNDTRGLIVSMIHKFEGMPENINTRKNIFVLIDEAHRTTGGDLGNYLMGALPNATYIGFTGTPIDKTKHGKGTFVIFGKDDAPQGYLDKYGVAESIEDGTTLKLYYTLAPNELKPDRETLEREFLNLAEAEGISDVEALNKVLDKAVNLRNMLKNEDRIYNVAKFVSEHFKNYVEPMGYKAFLVAVDREACALYKEALDKLYEENPEKYLPPEYSEVVISKGHNDTELLEKYHISKDKEKQIRKAFRNPDELPKILIVTEKLLTGFDAPILYCMYLDKPMRDHVLLQAIARVNRPYEDEYGRKKPSGFVLDFVGIFDKLEKALAFDSGDIEGVVSDVDFLKDRFKELMDIAKKEYLTIIKGKTRDKAIEAVLEYFRDEDKRQDYYEFFSEISDIYEIISPDKFLRPYIEDFDTLTRMYKILREAYDLGIVIDKEFARKTAKLVQEHTRSSSIKDTLDIYEIDENTIKRIEEDNATDTEKIFNLMISLNLKIKNEGALKPYLRSIGEKVELISTMYKQRQMTTKETLEKIKDIINETVQAEKEYANKNMSPEVFTIYWHLKSKTIKNAEDLANKTKNIFDEYPHWNMSEEHKRNVKNEMLKVLINDANIKPKDALELCNNIMKHLGG